MHKLFLMLTVAFLGLSLVAADAEAKRFGGGKSLGRSSPTYSRQATPPQAPAANPARSGAQRSGASRWLGPLAGLAAGGLLAAMLFGDGFEGFQFMDFLFLLLIAGGAFWFFRNMRRKQQAAYAGAGHHYHAHGPAPGAAPEIGSRLGGAGKTAGPPPPAARPAWFDEQAFLRAAKSHFVRLQAAWDKGDMEDIREYTTPQLFGDLTLERQELGSQPQFTEVVSLEARLLDLVPEGDTWVASVGYSGEIREERDAPAQPFNEVWIIQRKDKADANWYVAGIQQEGGRVH